MTVRVCLRAPPYILASNILYRVRKREKERCSTIFLSGGARKGFLCLSSHAEFIDDDFRSSESFSTSWLVQLDKSRDRHHAASSSRMLFYRLPSTPLVYSSGISTVFCLFLHRWNSRIDPLDWHLPFFYSFNPYSFYPISLSVWYFCSFVYLVLQFGCGLK